MSRLSVGGEWERKREEGRASRWQKEETLYRIGLLSLTGKQAVLLGFRAVRKGSARENGDAKIVVVDSYLRTESAAVNNGAGEGGESGVSPRQVPTWLWPSTVPATPLAPSPSLESDLATSSRVPSRR